MNFIRFTYRDGGYKCSESGVQDGEYVKLSDVHTKLQGLHLRLTELEAQLQQRDALAADNVTWICPDCRTVTVDPADVTALQAAHDAPKAENEQLRALLENTRQQRDDAYQERAEAQRWQPMPDGESHNPVNANRNITVQSIYKGQGFVISGVKDGEGVMLPDDIRLCRKVTP